MLAHDNVEDGADVVEMDVAVGIEGVEGMNGEGVGLEIVADDSLEEDSFVGE